MTSISQNQRYIPHEINTKYYTTNYIEYLNHH